MTSYESKLFRDFSIGQFFRMNIGGTPAICEKISTNKLRTKRLNNPGFLEMPINPHLCEDELLPCAPAWSSDSKGELSSSSYHHPSTTLELDFSLGSLVGQGVAQAKVLASSDPFHTQSIQLTLGNGQTLTITACTDRLKPYLHISFNKDK